MASTLILCLAPLILAGLAFLWIARGPAAASWKRLGLVLSASAIASLVISLYWQPSPRAEASVENELRRLQTPTLPSLSCTDATQAAEALARITGTAIAIEPGLVRADREAWAVTTAEQQEFVLDLARRVSACSGNREAIDVVDKETGDLLHEDRN